MGKSLDFVRYRINSGYGVNMGIEELEKAYEYEFTKVLDKYPEVKELYKNNKITLIVDGSDEHANHGKKNVTVKYNPDEEFEYFTMEACICDGTLIFMEELVDRIFRKVLTSSTYNKETAPDDYADNIWNYNMIYTVGDFVINDEYGDFGTDEKPWLQSRFTVMLPIKCEFILNKSRGLFD